MCLRSGQPSLTPLSESSVLGLGFRLNTQGNYAFRAHFFHLCSLSLAFSFQASKTQQTPCTIYSLSCSWVSSPSSYLTKVRHSLWLQFVSLTLSTHSLPSFDLGVLILSNLNLMMTWSFYVLKVPETDSQIHCIFSKMLRHQSENKAVYLLDIPDFFLAAV